MKNRRVISAADARVAALAGRRIDALASDTEKFPLAHIPKVSRRVRDLFVARNLASIVCSAACGADLIALEIARSMNLRTRIILPFDVDSFKRISVDDRPGNWEVPYFSAVDYAQKTGDLVIIGLDPKDPSAFSTTNRYLISETLRISGGSRPLAITVWDDKPRGPDDATFEFKRLAMQAEFDLYHVSTL